MRVGLFVPCYVDAFHPQVGIATLELLERFGIEVEYPFDQTCCGQPMTNSGCHPESAATEALFVRNFEKFDYIVGPSGSCVHHVRYNLNAVEQTDAVRKVRANTFELVEFLHDVLKVDAFPGHDKVQDEVRSGAEYVISSDSSCMMHQQGCAERAGLPMKYIHIAQVLNGVSS
jgi:Fe-S oxidoreductase